MLSTRGMTDEIFQRIVAAVIAAESSGDENVENPDSGAKGLMQLMDPTAYEILEEHGFDKSCYRPFNGAQNKLLGSLYLKKLIKQFGELKLALAAYNHGSGNVSRLLLKYGDFYSVIESNLPKATRAYVARISAQLNSEGIVI